ncbi:MAG TPA: hypothetical protein ENH10_09700 [Bacteroidetes bacterium]|nr:hypothetical protein [Bacteroidota bacterium]HEX05407.1 hypothetical protein [Bacteroidota bacterium]
MGGSISMLELGAKGDVVTVDGDVEFDVEEQNAYGLVSNNYFSTTNTLGLGWENNQLQGGKLFVGYRHSFHLATHLDFFWTLPRTEQLQGFPDEDDPFKEYVEQQSTRWTYGTTRLMIDYRPFEPLPLWFFTGGVEYVRFSSRLEFRWQYERISDGELIRTYEAYEDGGSAVGGVIGTGLQFFSNPETPRREWFIVMTYSYVPFNDPYFAWDGDFLLGGLALEGGLRVYLGDQQ